MTPFSCLYFVTYKCNSQCGYCNIWRNPALNDIRQARFIDAEQNIKDLKRIGVKLIDFTGGEPLLNNDLPQMLQTAKEQGLSVNLSTNCLLYPEKADELKGNVDNLFFSLDTLSHEEYQKIRGIDGFDKVMESIEIAKGMNQNVCLLYTVTNENIKNIASLIEFSRKNKIRLYIKPCFSYFGNEALDKEHIKTITKYFWKPYIRMSLTHMNFHFHGGNTILHPSCKTGIATFDISPDNCILVPCFQNQKQKLPLHGDLFSLYNSSNWIEAFSNVGRYPFCEHCSIECNFGLSYWNRLSEHFFLQNLTFLKYEIVHWSIQKDKSKKKLT
jgi:MoaA/NifB/PqqE/SkfB family radical SAM enzyme